MFRLATVFSLTAAFALMASAADWPGWRGAARDGILAPSDAPRAWPEQLHRKWRISVGEGHSSPILSAGRVYTFTRDKDREVVSSIDATTGKIAWQQSYPAPYTMNPAAVSHGPGPKSTPVYSDGRLFVLGISGILSAWDAASGKLLWRKEFNPEFKETSPDYGAAMSPIVDRGLLIAHVGGSGSGALAAFDVATGAMKWSWRGDGPAYASPIVVEIGGVRQVVTQTQQNIVGVSAAAGELLWKMPFTTEYVQNVITPVAYRDTLIFSGVDNPTFAVRLTRQGNAWSPQRIWENSSIPMYLSSPVLKGDFLFGFTHRKRGQFFCVDARTGKTLWTSPPREADSAAILAGGENLYLLKDDASLIVARATEKGFEPVHTYTVADSPTWAHPVITPNGVLIKDANSLAFWSVE